MNEASPIRPSVGYYWLAAAFLLTGIGVFTYSLSHGLPHLTDSLTQVIVPGETALALKGGEAYTVYLEERSVVNGKMYASNEPASGLRCELKSPGQEEVVPLRRPGGSMSYRMGDRAGSSMLEFSVPRDGQYHFSCVYRSGVREPETVLAIGSGVGGQFARTLLSAFGGALVGGILALVVFFRVYILRDRAIAHAAMQKQLPVSSGPASDTPQNASRL